MSDPRRELSTKATGTPVATVQPERAARLWAE
jgi:hypothetical protein